MVFSIFGNGFFYEDFLFIILIYGYDEKILWYGVNDKN